MLSHNTRMKLQAITDKIAKGEEVTLNEMTFAQKLANVNHSAAEILKNARRKAIQGESEEGTLDNLLQNMNLGEPDPSNHLTAESDIDDMMNFFKRNKPNDWRTRD